MAQTAFPLPPAGVAGSNLMSIDPQKNWRRYPSQPITKVMVTPAYVPNIASTTGAADEAAASDNNGETGTMSVSYNADAPYAQTGNYTPKTQLERSQAANLTAGTIIAPDVGKSYAADGTKRGSIEPDQPYPQSTATAPTTVTPAAFLPSNYVPPVTS